MDWKICAVEDLRRYNLMKIGILNSEDKLRAIDTNVKRAHLSSEKSRKHLDSRLVDAIVESERLKANISTAKNLTGLVERGLNSLSESERRILEMFYMNDAPKPAAHLINELGYSSRSIYRARDRALEKFTLAMYGVEML